MERHFVAMFVLICLIIEKIINNKIKMIKICQHSNDGFGHQLEGMIRLISLSLNNEKIYYVYDLRKKFLFEHSNFDSNKLNSYLLNSLDFLYSKHGKKITYNKIILNEKKPLHHLDSTNVHCYDGVGDGSRLPITFEDIDKLKKSLPELRDAFINCYLPKPSYSKELLNVVCHIRMGDAVGTRILDNNSIFKFIKQFDPSYNVIIHTNGEISSNEISKNVTIYDKNTDVLQILSDFIHADILIMNYSSLSIVAHLLAEDRQEVYCPKVAGPTFFDRILPKCKKIN
jgi:hypothetical protein